MRYDPVLQYNRDRMLPSSEVRVRYFDPRTGEPSPTKCEPLARARAKTRAEKEAEHDAAVSEALRIMERMDERNNVERAPKRPGRAPRAVYVDGERFASAGDAAAAVGRCGSSIYAGLRRNCGKCVINGHEVEYENTKERP